MHLIQFLLPLYDNHGRPVKQILHDEVKATLVEKFGGVTAHTKSPAEGHWSAHGKNVKDDLVEYEVMTADLDVSWWSNYRALLEEGFKQDQIVIRALQMQLL